MAAILTSKQVFNWKLYLKLSITSKQLSQSKSQHVEFLIKALAKIFTKLLRFEFFTYFKADYVSTDVITTIVYRHGHVTLVHLHISLLIPSQIVSKLYREKCANSIYGRI